MQSCRQRGRRCARSFAPGHRCARTTSTTARDSVTISRMEDLLSASHDLRNGLTRLRESLERQRDSLDAEIRAYPTPIPRCDAQFNHLYAERSRLTAQLQEIEEALRSGSPKVVSDCLRRIGNPAFVNGD